MLEKCLHGKTQNANESFNGTIWNRVPKANHVGLDTLCLGVYDAISHFNYGAQAAIDTLSFLGIDAGVHMANACSAVNRKRKRQSVYRATTPQKTRRKVLRHAKKKKKVRNRLKLKEPCMKLEVFKHYLNLEHDF